MHGNEDSQEPRSPLACWLKAGMLWEVELSNHGNLPVFSLLFTGNSSVLAGQNPSKLFGLSCAA
jgi:hypothetical protein